MVGNSKSNDFDFNRIEIWIKVKWCTRKWRLCRNGSEWYELYLRSPHEPLRFHKSQHQMHQMPVTRMQHNQFLLGQHLIHPQTYSGVTPVYFPHSYAYNWEYQYWWKMQYKLTLQLCEILYIHKKFLFYVTSSLMRKGSIMHHKVVDYRCIENFNSNYPYNDISLTMHDKNHQQFEPKRNNMIILP